MNIKERLLFHKREVKQEYCIEEDRILGIFATGNVNYGIIDYKLNSVAIVIPTFNDMITESGFFVENLELEGWCYGRWSNNHNHNHGM